MKKLIITTAIVLGMAMTGFAQDGMFHRANSGDNGNAIYESRGNMFKADRFDMPGLPGHGESGDQNAPLGSGIAVLIALGSAYAVTKRPREE